MNRARKLKRKMAVMNRRGANLPLKGTTLSPSAPRIADTPIRIYYGSRHQEECRRQWVMMAHLSLTTPCPGCLAPPVL